MTASSSRLSGIMKAFSASALDQYLASLSILIGCCWRLVLLIPLLPYTRLIDK